MCVFSTKVILILYLISCSSCSFIPKEYSLAQITKINPPEISLTKYLEEDSIHPTTADKKFLFQDHYQNDFISKSKNDYIAADGVRQVLFSCTADYPITWKFPFQAVHPLSYCKNN